MKRVALSLFAAACSLALPCAAAPAAKQRAAPPARWTPEAFSQQVAQLNAVLGAGADRAWDLTGGTTEKDGPILSVERDALIGQTSIVCGAKAFTLLSRTAYSNVEVVCRVRLAPEEGQRPGVFSLTAGRDPADPKSGFRLTVSGSRNGDITVTGPGSRARYDLRAYDVIRPTWDAAVRLPIEKDMAAAPLSQDKWVWIRGTYAEGALRLWVDDRLLVDRREPALKTGGSLQLDLQPGVHLTAFAVRPLPAAATEYETVRLDGYARDRALAGGVAVADDALPFGQVAPVAGIPFALASRPDANAPDHLDIGRSLLRQGNMKGYLPTRVDRYVGAWMVDPARIQLRVPNARYDALYVLAGFDGEPDSVPILTASFYRPDAGFAHIFEATVPALDATDGGDAKPVAVRLANGKAANLWLVRIPLDPGRLSSFSDLDAVEIELSKQMRLFRSYPDPISYGWHPAGLPSGVHVYGVTLHRPPVDFAIEPTVFGHVWTDPAVPAYDITFRNGTPRARAVTLECATASHDGTERNAQQVKVTVPANGEARETLRFPVKLNGQHRLTVTMKDGGAPWTEERFFARLAKDTRAPVWEEGKGPMFGYWSYHGGHYTPPATNIMLLMKLAGARGIMHEPRTNTPTGDVFKEWKWRGGPDAWPITPQRAWAGADPVDPAKFAAYRTNAVAALRARQGDKPELVSFFAEPAISRNVTAGHPSDYWGEPWQMTDDEKLSLRVFFNTAKSAAEGVRAAWPNTTIMIPWGDPLFVVPLLRAGFPKNLIDGSGLDMIGFERLPEQQLAQMSTHRLYILREEFRKAGIENPQLYYLEGTFHPTEPGALTWEEQAERYHRWSLLSLAYGVQRFYSGWFAFDCGGYYGAEHYGGCGIQRRIPYCDPKPAYAHYATMTRMLDQSRFEKWIPTGSHTVYCLQFSRPRGGPVYALWTVRGTRPVTLALAKDAPVTVTDSMDNGTALKPQQGAVTLTVGTAPVYITGPDAIASITLGAPDHSQTVAESRRRDVETWHTGPAAPPANPIAKEQTVANLGDGSWAVTGERDEVYEGNNFDVKRFPGRMTGQVVGDPNRPGQHLAVHLAAQEPERKLMPWYSVIKPARPLVIPGKAAALGLWVKAASDWGRVVYALKDAKGERWLSVGTKDQWNCNDPHGWSSFNFDGWRYLRFELPAHSPYDSFREAGTTWWGSFGGDGIVDLPLTLETVVVERRTHVLYVNDIQPANPADVLLGELVAEYETAADASDGAVAASRVRMPLPKGDFALANPIAEMAKSGEQPAVKLDKVTMPDWGYDGTRAHVHFDSAPDAAEYQVWVAAYSDGRGAVALGKLKQSGGLVNGLRPAMKLYLWVTYTTGSPKDKNLKPSKPSNRLEIELVDAFSQK